MPEQPGSVPVARQSTRVVKNAIAGGSSKTDSETCFGWCGKSVILESESARGGGRGISDVRRLDAGLNIRRRAAEWDAEEVS